MHEACEIIAKLVDDKKIDGKDAVILMHAVLNNNLKTSDWFNIPTSSWGIVGNCTTITDAHNNQYTGAVDISSNSISIITNP